MNKNNKSETETELVKEGSSIKFDIFGNKEIDLLPVIKKQRKKQVDDYDYNDPFFESFDGEFDPIDIECKLENFFIYKGDLVEKPKKIIRKYNKEFKKEEMKKNSVNEKKKKIKNEKKEELTFSFEKSNDIKKYYKNKKEPIYTNLISWLFYYENELISLYIRNSDNKISGLERENIFDFNDKNIYNYFLDEFMKENKDKNKNNSTFSDELEGKQKDKNKNKNKNNSTFSDELESKQKDKNKNKNKNNSTFSDELESKQKDKNKNKNKNNSTFSDELESKQKDNNLLEEFLKENMDISSINVYTNNNILNGINKKFKKNEITINEEEKINYLKKLINNVEITYDRILKELATEMNYSAEKKTFLKFRSEKFMNLIIKFYMNYIKYYCLNSGEIIAKSKNKAFKYLSSGFNENCTNANRLKFYVRRYIEEYLVDILKSI